MERKLPNVGRLVRQGLVFFCCISAAAQGGTRPLEAHLHGWGHSCSGELILTKRTLSWMTPWNPCRATGYRIAENHDTKTDLDRVYRLDHLSRGCFSRYVEVHYAYGAPGLAWDAEGFETYRAAKKKDIVGSEACLLEQVSARLPATNHGIR